MVANPTSSAIRVALGRTDVPTQDAADFFLPPQTIVHVPVNGRDFGFAFDTPASIGLSPNTTRVAQISAYSEDEKVGAIGSLSTSVSVSLVPNLDILQSGQPANPPINTARLWADVNGHLNELLSSGVNRPLLDSSSLIALPFAETNLGSDVALPAGGVGGILTITVVAGGIYLVLWQAQAQFNSNTGGIEYALIDGSGSAVFLGGNVTPVNSTAYMLHGGGRIFTPTTTQIALGGFAPSGNVIIKALDPTSSQPATSLSALRIG